jgi:hypothetical protein
MILTLWQDGPAYVDTLLTVLRNVTKEETVQYVLALLDDIITGWSKGATWDGMHCWPAVHQTAAMCIVVTVLNAVVYCSNPLTSLVQCTGDPSWAQLFHQRQGLAGVPDPYTIFLRCNMSNCFAICLAPISTQCSLATSFPSGLLT